MTIIKREVARKPIFGEKFIFVLRLLARDIANHSYALNTPLTRALKMHPPRTSQDLFVLKKGKSAHIF